MIRKEALRFLFRNIETQRYTVVGQRFNKDRSRSQQRRISTPFPALRFFAKDRRILIIYINGRTEEYWQDSDVETRPKQGNAGSKREKRDADYVKGKKKTRDA